MDISTRTSATIKSSTTKKGGESNDEKVIIRITAYGVKMFSSNLRKSVLEEK